MKKKLILISLVCALALLLSVAALAADTPTFTLTAADHTIVEGTGGTVRITVVYSCDSALDSFSASLNAPTGITLKSGVIASDFEGSQLSASKQTGYFLWDNTEMEFYKGTKTFFTFVVDVDSSVAAGSYDVTLTPDTISIFTDESSLTAERVTSSAQITKAEVIVSAKPAEPCTHPADKVTHEAEVKATCLKDGHAEYYYCDNCKQYFPTSSMTEAFDPNSGYDQLDHGNFTVNTDYTTKPALCDGTDGLATVYKCGNGCDLLFEGVDLDDPSTGYTIVTSQSVVQASGMRHTFTDSSEHKRVEPTCTNEGNVEYWVCNVCGNMYDKEVKEGLLTGAAAEAKKIADPTIAKVPHDPSVEVALVKATPSTQGTMKHYECSYKCGTIFEEQDVKTETTIDKLKFDWIEQGGPTPDAEDNADLKAKADADGYKVGFKSYDVTYQINDDNMTTPLRTPTASDLSKMDIVLPFPDGITKADTSKYEFEVLHQKADGSIETVKFTVTNDGFKLSGLTELSPFAVAWKDAAKQSGSGTKTDTAKKSGTSPKTGDETNIALWVVLFTVVLAAAVTTVIVAKKKIKSQN